MRKQRGIDKTEREQEFPISLAWTDHIIIGRIIQGLAAATDEASVA